MSSGRDEMLDRWNLEAPKTVEEQKDSALEHYMKRCSDLEHQLVVLKEEIKRLKWSLTEHD